MKGRAGGDGEGTEVETAMMRHVQAHYGGEQREMMMGDVRRKIL
jgi:hypothetical protein